MKKFLVEQLTYGVVFLYMLFSICFASLVLGAIFYYPLNLGLLDYFGFQKVTLLQLCGIIATVVIFPVISVYIATVINVKKQLKDGK